MRIPHIETESEFGLAGYLYTNIPRTEDLTWEHGKIMRRIMRQLAIEVARGDNATGQNAIWLNGGPPSNAPLPPYDVATLRARAVTCHAAETLIDPHDPDAYISLPYVPLGFN